jgi:ribosomal protein L11 methyltransferase
MIEVRIPIDAALAESLEAHFCEEYQQCWMLHENGKTHRHELRGFFESEAEAAATLAGLREEFPHLSEKVTSRDLQDRDWKEAYKLHFKPWSDRGLHWVPVWERENYPLPEGEEVVYLDPGMAFGTGNHETTRLCVLRLLDLRDEWGPEVVRKRVIDAGCGSGILAISARKVGFEAVSGFDNDPDSVRISLENATLCDLDGQIPFTWADLKEGFAEDCGDLLLVNILANILIDHAALLCEATRDGGTLVLSGILALEVEAVHAVFAPIVEGRTGQSVPFNSRTDGDWADLRYDF